MKRVSGYCTSVILAVALIWATPLTVQAADVAIVDGDTLDVGGVRYRLHGIDAPEAGQKCAKPNGGKWRCGRRAMDALAELASAGPVKCEGRGRDDFDRVLAVCTAGGVELNDAMVRRGHAWAFRKYSPDYVAAEKVAKAATLGVWRAKSEPPWEYRARRWQVGKQVAPDGCPIKGNISKSGRIYHAPWSPWYGRTKVSVKKGERWFCSEREALDAGWRAPMWGRRR